VEAISKFPRSSTNVTPEISNETLIFHVGPVRSHGLVEALHAGKSAPVAAIGGTMASKKILLVDDSKTALMMERAILEKRTTYQCVTASDGLEAVTKANDEHPDLVLMDVVMPRMNGFEACKKMRQQATTRETPIVLLTTRGEEDYMEAGFQSGCNDYLTKPVNGEELVKLLQSYLGE
jgi:CheY-like chemotaxis protein